MAQPQHIAIGQLGEDIVARYLQNRKFHVIERNYRKKWGELDIVAQKDDVLHFVEVKAGLWSREEWPREGEELYRPEDHMHANKCARMGRIVQTYIAEKKVPVESEWTVDLAVVLVHETTHKARVRWLWNMVL